MGTQLHELGHAVYDKWIDQTLPFLLRLPAHTSMTEAIAMLFGRLSKTQTFIQKYCHPGDISELKNVQTQVAEQLLVFIRWALVMVHFEQALYQNPQRNLNALWWDFVERFQKVRRVPDRNAPDWASKLHLACAPAYYQNYILGEMIASQLKHYIDVNRHNCLAPEAGEWLKEKLFHSGSRFSWEATLKNASGENLNPAYLVKDME
jgi:peptidyl-dipeptidase A